MTILLTPKNVLPPTAVVPAVQLNFFGNGFLFPADGAAAGVIELDIVARSIGV
jgi:hypothetical protein